MVSIHLSGRITETGKLEVELPEGLPPGEIELTIEIPAQQQAGDDRPWTDEEIAEMMRVEPKTGAEIAASDVIGAWADRGISDSVEWVKELRRKRRERRGW